MILRVKRARSLALAFWLVVIGMVGAAQSPKNPVSAIEILAIRNHAIDVKLLNLWPYPVSIWVCDTPRRLNELGYYLEAYSGKSWNRLKPADGRHLGDLKPEYLEIGDGRTDSLPASIHPEAFGGSAGMKLRIVIRAWHTERDSLGLVHTISQEPLLLTSGPFVLKGHQDDLPQ
jgi:hypothetical protein